MNKSDLKSLIRECFVEIIKESRNMDPSKEEMIAFLQTTPYKSEEGFADSAEVAMYWFASDYHGGQNSNLYSVLSTSPYTPSRLNTGGIEGEKDDFIAQDLYQSLVDKYFPGHSAGHPDGIDETSNQNPNDIIIIKPENGKPSKTTWSEFKVANAEMDPSELAQIEKDLNEKGQSVVGGGAAQMFTIVKKKTSHPTEIRENDGQPVESELKRTQSDFEGGKIPRGLTSNSVKVQVKTELKSKEGISILKPSQTIDVFFGKKHSHVYLFSEGKWWSLSIQNASKYLTKFKPIPSMASLERMSNDGIVTTPLGTRTEPDGTGPNGEPSWLLVMGLI